MKVPKAKRAAMNMLLLRSHKKSSQRRKGDNIAKKLNKKAKAGNKTAKAIIAYYLGLLECEPISPSGMMTASSSRSNRQPNRVMTPVSNPRPSGYIS